MQSRIGTLMAILIALFVSTSAQAGSLKAWAETQTIFVRQDVDQQLTGTLGYNLPGRVDLYTFATCTTDGYRNAHGGLSIGSQHVILELGLGVDHVTDTKFRYAMGLYLLMPDGISGSLNFDNGPNGAYLKEVIRVELNRQVKLAFRAEMRKGFGPQVEVSLPGKFTLAVASLHGYGYPVTVVGINR